MREIPVEKWRYPRAICNYGSRSSLLLIPWLITIGLAAGINETQAEHATFWPETNSLARECVLSGKTVPFHSGYHPMLFQCNPPERAPRQEKERSPLELFIRHLIYDVLAKKTIDKVLKLIRKLDWEDASIKRTLHKVFTKPWKIKYGHISLLAMLTYDLQRYHPSFAIAVVDQVLEDIRRGLEQNVYSTNQRRVATMKYLGELYIYRLLGSGIIFDTLWSLVTFGHRKFSFQYPFAYIWFAF